MPSRAEHAIVLIELHRWLCSSSHDEAKMETGEKPVRSRHCNEDESTLATEELGRSTSRLNQSQDISLKIFNYPAWTGGERKMRYKYSR